MDILERLLEEQLSESLSIEVEKAEFLKLDVNTYAQVEEIVAYYYRHFLLLMNGEQNNLRGG